jgi:hypothetical protein
VRVRIGEGTKSEVYICTITINMMFRQDDLTIQNNTRRDEHASSNGG